MANKPGFCTDCREKPLPKGQKAGLCESCKRSARRIKAIRKKGGNDADVDAGEREARMLHRGRSVPRS